MQRIGTTWKQFTAGERFDAIVIGSGVGGLCTAALLARHASRRVLVLERHYVAGGFTHVFERPGYEWDVGVHYVGEVHTPRSLTRRLFDHLSDGRLQWAPMDDVYDRIVLGGESLNAADLQIASNLRLLMALADLRPALEARPCGQLALRVFPEFPGDVAAGAIPAEFLAQPAAV